jgi:RHS repeat-associated protein
LGNRLASTPNGTGAWLFNKDGNSKRVSHLVTEGAVSHPDAVLLVWRLRSYQRHSDRHQHGQEVLRIGRQHSLPPVLLGDAMSNNGVMQYLFTDHLGSVVAVTDNLGTLLEDSRYMPFGNVRSDVGSVTQTDKSFTGQKSLANTGLMDYKARMYDSELGRFVQPDIFIPIPTFSQSYNRFSYVGDNPIIYIDPSGNKPCWAGKTYRCNLSINQVSDLLGSTDKHTRDFGKNYLSKKINLSRFKESSEDCNSDALSCALYYLLTRLSGQSSSKMFDNCIGKTYSECYRLGYLTLTEGQQLDPDQFSDLLVTVYSDFVKRDVNNLQSWYADTPFWDGGHPELNVHVCLGNNCWPRSEINYFAEGMLSALIGESLDTAHEKARLWKEGRQNEYTEGTEFWIDFGYYFVVDVSKNSN